MPSALAVPRRHALSRLLFASGIAANALLCYHLLFKTGLLRDLFFLWRRRRRLQTMLRRVSLLAFRRWVATCKEVTHAAAAPAAPLTAPLATAAAAAEAAPLVPSPPAPVLPSRPTHFIGVRTRSEALCARVADVQGRILSEHPHLAPCAIADSKLHVSLLVCTLAGDADVRVVCEALEAAVAHVSADSPPPLSLVFDRLGTFGRDVLWAGPDSGSDKVLRTLHGALAERCIERNVTFVGREKIERAHARFLRQAQKSAQGTAPHEPREAVRQGSRERSRSREAEREGKPAGAAVDCPAEGGHESGPSAFDFAFDFSAHMTVMKASQGMRKMKHKEDLDRLRKMGIPTDPIKQLMKEHVGAAEVCSVELLAMQGKGEGGYYPVVHTVQWGAKKQTSQQNNS